MIISRVCEKQTRQEERRVIKKEKGKKSMDPAAKGF